MAEEFSLAVSVTADLAQFRTQLRAELEAVKQQGATIPVGAAGGAAGASVVPPGAAGATVHPGASPTATAVAQQSAQASAGAAARAFNPNGWQALNPGGWAAVNAAQGGPGAGPASINPGAGFGAAPVPNPGANFGAGPGGPIGPAGLTWPEAQTIAANKIAEAKASMRGGRGYGYGRSIQFLTGAYIGNAVGRLVDASNQYNEAVGLSRGDPEALALADIEHRQRFADAFPVAGRLALSAREAATGEEASIRRTLQDARDQNSRTRSMRDIGAMSQRFRSAGEIAGARGAAQARLTAEFEYQSSIYDVRQASQAAGDEAAAKFQQMRQDVDTEYNKRLGVEELRYKTKPAADAWRDSQLQSIQAAQDDAAQKRKDRFGPMLSAAEAVKRRANADITRDVDIQNFANQGGAIAARLRIQNQPFAASVSQRFTDLSAQLQAADPELRGNIARRGFTEIAESFVDFARDFGHQQRQLSAQQRVNQKLLDRDPVGARIAAIEGQRDEALEQANALPWGFRQLRQASIRRGAAQDTRIERQQDDDARQLRIQALDNRKEHYDLLAQGKPYTAQATDIRRQTEEDVAAMRQSQRYTPAEIKKRIEEGISQEKAFEHDLRRRMNSGLGMEVSPGAFGPGVSGGNSIEPIVTALNAVKAAIEAQTALFSQN